MTSDEPDAPQPEPPALPGAPHGLRVSTLDAGTEDGAARTRQAARVWRWGLRLGGGVALLGLLAVVAVAISPLIPRPAPPSPRPLAIIPFQVPGGAIYPYSGAAWSPDGRYIALVRDSAGDPNALTDPNDSTVLIFDSHTGRLFNGFSLDRMLMPPSAPPGTQVALDGVIWTADSQRIAVLFNIFEPDQSGSLWPSASGAAELTVRGAYPGELASATEAPLPASAASLPDLTGPQPAYTWRMLPSVQGPRREEVTPAYAYRWGTEGMLTPVSRASQPGDVNMWRSGSIQLINAYVCLSGGGGKFQRRPYLALTLSTLAWSPGSAYLAGLSVTGRYDIPTTAATPTPGPGVAPGACSAGPAYDSAPAAPPPDAGLAAVETLAAASASASVTLAWRSDHQRLAAFPLDITGAGSILIYNCRTGALVTRITASEIPISGPPGTGPAKNFSMDFAGGVWSPDGKSLLVESSGSGASPFVLEPAALGE